MYFWTFCLICLARTCMADGLNCSLTCVCCKEGKAGCRNDTSKGLNYCFDGCKDGIYGLKCHNPCPKNCSTCEQELGTQCYSCKDTFYDKNNKCNERCSDGCEEGICNVDGTCTCIHGRHGANCTLHCVEKNCYCSNGTDCTSCITGFYDRSTLCETPCSPGCEDGVCKDDGSCHCQTSFTGNTCSECQSGYYGTYCNVSCSVGCVNKTCSKDGTCSCRANFVTAKCDTCAVGRSGLTCDHINMQNKVGPPVGAIAGGVSGGIVVIIVIVVAFVFIRRRSIRLPANVQTKRHGNTTFQANMKKEPGTSVMERTYYNEGQIQRESTKPNTTGTRPAVKTHTSIMEQVSAHVETTSDKAIDDKTYYNEFGSSTTGTKVPIGELVKYVDGKTHEAFRANFEKLSCGLVKPYVESQKRENISRNRYKGIYPYDDSMVKVTGSGGSDYINASFIDGYEKPNHYIATLGPMSEQLGDFSLFWNMIWQQMVERIVMVTNLIEIGSHKCEQYWPNPGTTKTFGKIKVESRSEDEYAEFTRRTFTVTMGGKERSLHHLHFTCWPDKAVPDDVTAMIEFRQRVLSTPSTLNGPTVVHCSHPTQTERVPQDA
ncbi:PTPRT-like protein [Mya arenaria]|uniref:protein-tyrosine-phosphatase n=1 Tax=Mya arenaria TaxID=6604 RepID=A0ABY7FB43_MYAAR|nr:PTPRT-like protein [Mya arenaria]